MADAIVRVRGLRYELGGRTILALDALELGPKDEIALTGPSGCGKTSLLTLIAGLARASEGRIEILGCELGALAHQSIAALDRFRSRHIGFVPQQPMLFSALDVLANLEVAQSLAGVTPDREMLRSLLARMDMAGLEHRRPSQLSRGQQQRVAVARALAQKPVLVLADEPTANLDDEQTQQVLDLLRSRSQALGAALVVATHDARVRDRFERRLVLNRQGQAQWA